MFRGERCCIGRNGLRIDVDIRISVPPAGHPTFQRIVVVHRTTVAA
jgi:hypothetical protein